MGEITEPVDCIVLGRKLAQDFIPYWASNPEEEGANKFINTKKVVFTKTLDRSEWDNTVLAKGDLVDEITKLKKQDGKEIIAYGGATFVSALKWIKLLRQNARGIRRSVILPIILITMNTCLLLVIIGGTAAQ